MQAIPRSILLQVPASRIACTAMSPPYLRLDDLWAARCMLTTVCFVSREGAGVP